LRPGTSAATPADMIVVYLIVAAFVLLAFEGPQHVHGGT
jgi:hypothetical protein